MIWPYTACRANTGDMKPKPGRRIILIELPLGFLHDLPQEDQQAIEDVVGKPIRLNKYDTDGRAELEFRDRNGCLHKIYVGPGILAVHPKPIARVHDDLTS